MKKIVVFLLISLSLFSVFASDIGRVGVNLGPSFSWGKMETIVNGNKVESDDSSSFTFYGLEAEIYGENWLLSFGDKDQLKIGVAYSISDTYDFSTTFKAGSGNVNQSDNIKMIGTQNSIALRPAFAFGYQLNKDLLLKAALGFGYSYSNFKVSTEIKVGSVTTKSEPKSYSINQIEMFGSLGVEYNITSSFVLNAGINVGGDLWSSLKDDSLDNQDVDVQLILNKTYVVPYVGVMFLY